MESFDVVIVGADNGKKPGRKILMSGGWSLQFHQYEAIQPPASSPLTEQDKNREIEYRLKKIKAFRAALDMKKIEQRLSAIRQFNLDSYAAEQGRGASSEQGMSLPSPPLPKQ
ncbi:hypothetical protein [Symbiopectobacterium sp.]|uniref:hypothetical protein n=1 Tax=Symbiopectobacterium sp. TaxID=2952789 RepID=UPI003F3125CA